MKYSASEQSGRHMHDQHGIVNPGVIGDNSCLWRPELNDSGWLYNLYSYLKSLNDPLLDEAVLDRLKHVSFRIAEKDYMKRAGQTFDEYADSSD